MLIKCDDDDDDNDDDDDDYDDDDDDDELFLWYGWPVKDVKFYFRLRLLSEILTIANLQHATSRIRTCLELEVRDCWMKLCSSDNHYSVTIAAIQGYLVDPEI